MLRELQAYSIKKPAFIFGVEDLVWIVNLIENTVSLLQKLRTRNSKEILRVKEIDTEFGFGYKIDVATGSTKKVCHLIQDKDTGKWKTLGDPNACRILARILYYSGTPMTGLTTSEKLKEQSDF